MSSKQSFILLVIFFPVYGLGQLRLNCGGIRHVIPHFSNADKEILSDQPLVEKNILQPITSSSSEFEIRFSYFFYAHEITIVAKCINDSVSVTSYNAYVVPKSTLSGEELSIYTDAGPYKHGNDTKRSVFYAKSIGLKSNSNLLWNEIISGLIKNHFFDLPSQGTIDRIAKKCCPQAVKPMDGGYLYYEIKVGKAFRFFEAGDDYIDVAAIAKYSRYKQNIFNLLLFH
jgi:hypothetical protein